MEKLEWSALEYEEKERDKNWFWALGIIVATSAITSIIYGNYFFAALILLGGSLLAFFAIKNPELVNYEINLAGVKIRSRLYPFENIKSFWVQADPEGRTGLPPMLFIKSERLFMPVISIPITEDMAEDIYYIMTSKNIPEEEMKEHASLKIMESLGF